MRVAAIAVILGVSSGTEGIGCQGGAPDQIEISWAVPPGPGTRGVELLGCHGWGRELGTGTATLEPGWDACAMRAWRRDGRLRVTSTPVQIDGDASSMHVDFDLPEGPIGGMGAQVRAGGRSVTIEAVIPDTPAARADIVAGTRVMAVNGDSTSSMSTAGFVRAVTGMPGTPVVLTLLPPGASDTHRTVIVRQPIP